ncbi:ABC transporter substrate-binding protein [Paenibacillus sp. FSL H8-0548]|uniref:ABC transporter substrate-binding protein n=1 Tax=Paenibacillus sp. FSL H8-0548 TaxID=1920422 RepID=UPI00096D4A41|nr:sugar ABC transporter substrate-binding protein [Paenibacillus sp. FSL H8-0548]OMF30764.1 ABC transporter substrate-binding protein [Paenibacillus sp. FSL H8-0548]
MRKRSGTKTILFVFLAVMMIVTACANGNNDSGQSKNTAVNGNSTKDKSSGTNEQVKLKFTFWGSPQEKKAVEDAIKAFEGIHKNITIEPVHITGTDFLQKLNAMIAGNEAPDLSYSAAWKLKMGEEDLIYNFFDLIKEDPSIKKEDYLEYGWWNWDTDKSAGPYQAAVVPSLMYNADMFQDAGVEVPPTKASEAWTWDEFVETAKKLTLDRNGKHPDEAGFDPKNIKQYGVKFSLSWISYMPLVLSNGGDYLTDDGKELGLAKPEAAEAIQKIADLINVHHVAPSPVQASSIPAPATALQSKKVAMVIDGSWNHLDLSKANINWGVGVLPILKEYKSFFLGGSLIIFKSSKHPKEAWEFSKFLTDPNNVLEMHQGLWMPQLTKWYEDPQLIDSWANEELSGRPIGFQDAVMRSTFEHAEPAPENNVKNFVEIDAAVAASLDQVWLGTKSAEEALKEAEERIKPLVQGTYLK